MSKSKKVDKIDDEISLDSDDESNNNNDSSSSDDENRDINPVLFFTQKELCWYRIIDRFFKQCDTNAINKMVDIIESKSKVSLRILEWFVTKYSRRGINWKSTNNDGDTEMSKLFDVRVSYKSQIRGYGKKYFDPFRRRKKFKYYFNKGLNDEKSIDTTLCQLNFFRWALTYNIIDYVEQNLKKINKELNSASSGQMAKKAKKLKKKNDSGNEMDKTNLESNNKSSNDSKSNESKNEKIIIHTSDSEKSKPIVKNVTSQLLGKECVNIAFDNSCSTMKVNSMKNIIHEETKIVLTFD